MSGKLNVLMVGPGLQATSGISNVVNNWLEAGLSDKLNLDYVSTLDEYVPGHYVVKFCNAVRSYCQVVAKSFGRVDILHIHLSSGMSFYRKLWIFWYAKLRRISVAVHLHGSEFKEFYDHGTRIRRWLIRGLFDYAEATFVLSHSWLAFVQSISSNRHIHLLYNGALVAKFGSKLVDPDAVVIAFMGRLGARKGVYDLLEAFELLAKEVTAARLVLGGDGDVENVKAVVEKKSLDKHVSVLGWVSGDRKIEVFRKADIYVLPSYNEGLPGSILEAMAAGAPIVSTPVGGIPEAVIDGTNGFLVQPGDIKSLHQKLLILCTDRALRERMGRESKRLIEEKFDIRRIVEDLVDCYQQMLAPNSR